MGLDSQTGHLIALLQEVALESAYRYQPVIPLMAMTVTGARLSGVNMQIISDRIKHGLALFLDLDQTLVIFGFV